MSKPKILTLSAIPTQLQQLPQTPRQLFVLGDDLSELMQRPRVAIVGARKITPYGRYVTAQLATELARAGVVVVSGLALGVDSVAHRACLEAGGATVAVLPCSVNHVYPRSHSDLAEQIKTQGCLISENNNSTVGYKNAFLERNRIIAALADMVIITEAAERSGSLNTAAHALDIGRELGAVPGNINAPMSAGCNKLLRSGAHCITSANDVLSILKIQRPTANTTAIAMTQQEEAVIAAIKSGITEKFALEKAVNLPLTQLQQTLTMLELNDIIRAEAGHWHLI